MRMLSTILKVLAIAYMFSLAIAMALFHRRPPRRSPVCAFTACPPTRPPVDDDLEDVELPPQHYYVRRSSRAWVQCDCVFFGGLSLGFIEHPELYEGWQIMACDIHHSPSAIH